MHIFEEFGNPEIDADFRHRIKINAQTVGDEDGVAEQLADLLQMDSFRIHGAGRESGESEKAQEHHADGGEPDIKSLPRMSRSAKVSQEKYSQEAGEGAAGDGKGQIAMVVFRSIQLLDHGAAAGLQHGHTGADGKDHGEDHRVVV